MRKKGKLQAFLTIVLLLGISPIVRSATFTVTTTEDNVAGSLREAITTANSNNENDTIHLPAGTYFLAGTPGENGNLGGDLDINTDDGISIVGEGASTTFIDGDQVDRVFHIIKGTVTIFGVTIQNGKTPDSSNENEHPAHGGGILNRGSLTLSYCTLRDNVTRNGGDGSWPYGSGPGDGGDGGKGGGVYNDNSLCLSHCTISGNQTGRGGKCTLILCVGGFGGDGGGIYNSGVLDVTDCSINDNTTGDGGDADDDHCILAPGGYGGGIYNEGTQYLKNCTISNNKTGDGGSHEYLNGDDLDGGRGGGIYNTAGDTTLENCTVSGNTTGNTGGDGGDGGGIYNNGILTVSDSNIMSNYTFCGDSGGSSGNGGGIFNDGILILSNSTIGNNYTKDALGCGHGGHGGGIYNGESASLTNCTVSGNKAGNGGTCYNTGGNGGSGGGIYTRNFISLTHCTICNNTTGSRGAGQNWEYGEPGNGGGIYINDTAANLNGVNIKNTIVADNRTAGRGEGPDCYGILNSQGYNLIEDISQCDLGGSVTGCITGQDPMLDELAHNGGPTKTHALQQCSPAVDAGARFGISVDQRGYSRLVDIEGITNNDDGTDIGAYEYRLPHPGCHTISGHITHGGNGIPGVLLTCSNNGGTVTTDESGNYSKCVLSGWSGTVTPAKKGWSFSPPKTQYTAVGADQAGQDYTAQEAALPEISLNRTRLNFSAEFSTSTQTGPQTVLINNSSGGMLNWTVSRDVGWVSVTPDSGTGPGVVSVSVDHDSFYTGTYTTSIHVEDPNAVNSPQTVEVRLEVVHGDLAPFGEFETPVDGSTVNGSIPVTGWALDDICVESVKIYREDDQSLVYIGDAVFVEGARPDIEEDYLNEPNNYKAGWGYMLLTHFLPNGGNGTFTIHVAAVDNEGFETILGTKTITCDNANAVKPFGAIDTPTQGGNASGGSFRNWGWALTPLPNTIPFDGSTIRVWVDGVQLGNPVYNLYREDIAELFPGYNNSNGASGYFDLDTTSYTNGVHTIYWTAEDDAGNSDGIGSRYFVVQNTGGRGNPSWLPGPGGMPDISNVPVDDWSPVRIKRGYNPLTNPKDFYPGDNGIITVEIRELERIEISFVQEAAAGLAPLYPALPIGSTFDAQRGVFYWQPGPGFIGDYPFTFILTGPNGMTVRKNILVKIFPKFPGETNNDVLSKDE